MTTPSAYYPGGDQKGQKTAYGGVRRFYGALLIVYGIVTMLLLAGVAFYVYSRAAGPAIHQPIAYNHKKHLALGLECANCHLGIAEDKQHARIPTVEVCAACHTSGDENPRTKVVREYVAQNKPIPWKRNYIIPEHVYFSHRRHVGLAKLDCIICHGDMTKVEAPVTKQAVEIKMKRCVDCHHKMKVSTDCIACHR